MEDPLEKEMATHSSVPTWRIPWTEEHGRLQSTGLEESAYLETKPPPPLWHHRKMTSEQNFHKLSKATYLNQIFLCSCCILNPLKRFPRKERAKETDIEN